MDTSNLIIIGSSHISKGSVMEIKNKIDNMLPDIIAVELDRNRMMALLSGQKTNRISLDMVPRIGLQGFLFLVIGSWIQKKLGKHVNMDPGADMKIAILEARKRNLPLYLIDQNIEVTLSRFSKAITWHERFNFFADLLKAPFVGKKEIEKMGITSIDLTRVPSEMIVEKLITHFKGRYPNVYRVLVHERNIVMARNLAKIILKNPDKKVLAVVGAGHREGLKDFLNKIDII